jgi:hypothetical protein
MYGGQSTGVFNDFKSFDPDSLEWKILQLDGYRHDLQGRFAHCMGGFDRFVITFGGQGPFN